MGGPSHPGSGRVALDTHVFMFDNVADTSVHNGVVLHNIAFLRRGYNRLHIKRNNNPTSLHDYITFHFLQICGKHAGRYKNRMNLLLILILNRQGVETMPRILFIDADSEPLNGDTLLALPYRTSGMLGPSRVHLVGVIVEVGKEDGSVKLGLDMNVGVAEVGRSALLRYLAVHDHRGNSAASLVPKAGAISVAVRPVVVGRRVVVASTLVLDAHEVLLSGLFDAVPGSVVDVVVQASADGGDAMALGLLLPRNSNSGLHGLSRGAVLAPALAIGDGGPVKDGIGGGMDGVTFLGGNEILDNVDLAGRAIVHDEDVTLDAVVHPGGSIDRCRRW